MYGFVIPNEGMNYIRKFIAGEETKLTLSKIQVGSGVFEGTEDELKEITELIEPVALASSTTPEITSDGKVTFTVIYRNDMNGGLQESFLLGEFGVFADTAGGEILLYYGTLGEQDRQPVRALTSDTVDIRRFPVEIQITNDITIVVNYDCSNFTTSDEFEAFKNEVRNQLITSIEYESDTETLVIKLGEYTVEGIPSDHPYVIASATTLGHVRIGDNVDITTDGVITANGDMIVDGKTATDDEVEEMLDDVFGKE